MLSSGLFRHRHTCGTQTHMQAKHSYTYNENFSNLSPERRSHKKNLINSSCSLCEESISLRNPEGRVWGSNINQHSIQRHPVHFSSGDSSPAETCSHHLFLNYFRIIWGLRGKSSCEHSSAHHWRLLTWQCGKSQWVCALVSSSQARQLHRNYHV